MFGFGLVKMAATYIYRQASPNGLCRPSLARSPTPPPPIPIIFAMIITPSRASPARQTVLSQRHHARQRLFDLHIRSSELQLEHIRLLQQRMVEDPSAINTFQVTQAIMLMDGDLEHLAMYELLFGDESEEDEDDYVDDHVNTGIKEEEFDDEDSDSEIENSESESEEASEPIQTEDEKRQELFQKHQLRLVELERQAKAERQAEAERQAKARSQVKAEPTPSGSFPSIDCQPTTSNPKAHTKKSRQSRPAGATGQEPIETKRKALARSVIEWRRSIN